MFCVHTFFVSRVLQLFLCIPFFHCLLILQWLDILHCSVSNCRLRDICSLLCNYTWFVWEVCCFFVCVLLFVMFSVQLCFCWILCKVCLIVGKCLWISVMNIFPMLDFTFSLYGGLNKMMFLYLLAFFLWCVCFWQSTIF